MSLDWRRCWGFHCSLFDHLWVWTFTYNSISSSSWFCHYAADSTIDSSFWYSNLVSKLIYSIQHFRSEFSLNFAFYCVFLCWFLFRYSWCLPIVKLYRLCYVLCLLFNQNREGHQQSEHLQHVSLKEFGHVFLICWIVSL